MLPGQSLKSNNQLLSSMSKTDRSTGKYQLINQMDGNLVAYPVITTINPDDSYWSTDTYKPRLLHTLQFDKTGLLYLTDNDGAYIKNITQPESFISSKVGIQVYYRAVMDVDGILRVYSHSFSSNGNSTARVEWAAPDNRCLVKGVCSLNSYCSLGADKEPMCFCPPGYDFVDPIQTSLGCVAKSSTHQNCDNAVLTASSGGINLMMATLTNTTWVNQPYFISPSLMSVEDCKAMCLEDCLCKAALYVDGTCNKQMLPLNLKYGRTGSNDMLLVKVGMTEASVEVNDFILRVRIGINI